MFLNLSTLTNLGLKYYKMDTFSKVDRSKIMACVKAKGNKSTELKAIQIFKELHIIGWRRNYSIEGKPDFVFLKHKLAVFIDGCFWHGCKNHCRFPSSNIDYWKNKIARNVKRAQVVNKLLRKRGWHVIRIWEHELKKPVDYLKFKKIKRIILR